MVRSAADYPSCLQIALAGFSGHTHAGSWGVGLTSAVICSASCRLSVVPESKLKSGAFYFDRAEAAKHISFSWTEYSKKEARRSQLRRNNHALGCSAYGDAVGCGWEAAQLPDRLSCHRWRRW